MKSFDSRTYNLNDFVEWDSAQQLELNPRFQRRAVWNDKAKSFLIDTILRGKPIPKIFIRQKINVTTKTSTREVVDGQQRLRTILSFIKDGFLVNKNHNIDYGGLYYSQLPENIQAQILSYEVSVDLLINLPDSEVLDIFSRLNTYSVILNEQEKINANHFGSFKSLADKIGHKYYDYWIKQGILGSNQILRMQEVTLVADLLIAMIEGIKSKKQIKKYYDIYEENFLHDVDDLEKMFDQVIIKINQLYSDGIATSELRRAPVFYSLFLGVFHSLYGLPSMHIERPSLNGSRLEVTKNNLDFISEIFDTLDVSTLEDDERQFRHDSRLATTDEKVRIRRTKFLISVMSQ